MGHCSYNATMRIEERVVGEEVKYVMPRVWVQFTGLPLELGEFEVIWAVGSILGVSKKVDMKFTRKFDRSRLQVMVLDPNLIPQYVDVVIGDYLYELQFRVEENVDENNPEPMDMDAGKNEDNGEQGKGEDQGNDNMETDDTAVKNDQSASQGINSKKTDTGSQSSGVKKARQIVHLTIPGAIPSMVQMQPNKGIEELPLSPVADMGVDTFMASPGGDGSVMTVGDEVGALAGQATPDSLAAIPEARQGASATHSSKRRAASTDEDSVQLAARLKAGRNLQFTEGTQDTPESFINFSKTTIVSGLSNIGVSIGVDNKDIDDSIELIKQVEQSRLKEESKEDFKTVVFDNEEKDMANEDEVDRLILSNLCTDIMDEVLDMSSEHLVVAHTDHGRQSSLSKKGKRGNKHKKNNLL